MRIRLLLCALLVAVAAPAVFAADSVLTAGGALYSVANHVDGENAVYLVRRSGQDKTTIVVPATEDTARESGVQLEYDRATDKVYVAWIRGTSEIHLAALDNEGQWSTPHMVRGGDPSQTIGELRLALTHAKNEDRDVTLVHAVWWQKAGTLAPKYGLVAFESKHLVSTYVSDLEEMAALRTVTSNSIEAMGNALYPPLAMAAQRDATVDVVFGSDRTTALSRIIIQPRTEARLWRPGKGPSTGFPPARLVSLNTTPIQAFLGRDRLILYTLEGEFRFVVLTDGEWSPVRTIQTDDKVTREQILSGLRRLGGE